MGQDYRPLNLRSRGRTTRVLTTRDAEVRPRGGRVLGSVTLNCCCLGTLDATTPKRPVPMFQDPWLEDQDLGPGSHDEACLDMYVSGRHSWSSPWWLSRLHMLATAHPHVLLLPTAYPGLGQRRVCHLPFYNSRPVLGLSGPRTAYVFTLPSSTLAFLSLKDFVARLYPGPRYLSSRRASVV